MPVGAEAPTAVPTGVTVAVNKVDTPATGTAGSAVTVVVVAPFATTSVAEAAVVEQVKFVPVQVAVTAKVPGAGPANV